MEAVTISIRTMERNGKKILKVVGEKGFDFGETRDLPDFEAGCLDFSIDKRGYVRLRARINMENSVLVDVYHKNGFVIYGRFNMGAYNHKCAVIDPLKMISMYF